MLGDLALTAKQAVGHLVQRGVLRRYRAPLSTLAAEVEGHLP
jgi:hypothetical protein